MMPYPSQRVVLATLFLWMGSASTATATDSTAQMYNDLAAFDAAQQQAAHLTSPHATAPPPPPLAPFRFALIFSDSMVLQRDRPASVWGWAPPGAQVAVAVGSDTPMTTTASAKGQWRVSLPAHPASSTATTVTAKSGGVTLTLSDVLFGDVWLCSGQSNMAFSAPTPLHDPAKEAEVAAAYATDPGASIDGQYMNASEGIAAAADLPNIRLLVVGNRHNCLEPIEDFYPSINDSAHALAHPWARASPANVGLGPDVMGGAGGGFSATCWYYGMELNKKVGVPIGLVHSSYGGSAVEDWISNETLNANGGATSPSNPCPGQVVGSMGLPSQQYNGQLRPLVNMTIKGAVWYQGESNGGQNELYSCRFHMMMTEWRQLWYEGTGGATDPNFPIGFVQIGPYGQAAGPASPDSEKCFAIRIGQTGGFGYAPNAAWPNTFMSTGFDLMNPPGTNCVAGCIHIFNKQAVGHRLAVAARHWVYNESNLVSYGPVVKSLAYNAGTPATVTLTYGLGTEGGGIKLRSAYGFEVCGKDCGDGFAANLMQAGNTSGFTAANVTGSTATTVTLTVPSVLAGTPIVTVRYAFDDAPSLFFTPSTQPAVYNAEGLPANPGVWNITTA